MPISPLLQRFVEDELNRCADTVQRTVGLTLEQLKQPRQGMLASTERQHYAELVQALQKKAQPFEREFCEALGSLVRSDVRGLASGQEAPISAGGGLELMDEARVEVDIEVSRAAQLIEGSAEWELRELHTFTSTLAGQQHVSADTNPLRPVSFARALWEAAGAVTAVPVQRSILLRTAAGVMSGQLKMAWAAACTRLESQGVEGIYRTVVLPSGAAPRRSNFDVTQPGALESLLPAMPVGAPASPSPARPTRTRSPSASPAFEQALVRLEALLRRVVPAMGDAGGSAAQLGDHRATLLESTAEMVDRQIVELLSRVFAAVLSDRRLAAPLRTVMARLQVSALRVALVDPGMLETHEHPVWRLMNRIAGAGEAYTQPGDPRGVALISFCEALVEDMAHARVQDTALYQQSLTRLDAFLAEQLHEQQRRAQPAIAALELSERREDLERHLAQRLTEQMVPIRASAVIRRFITGAWAKVLAEAMLRFGEKVEPTTGYLKAVDELLWSLRLPDHPQSRQRLLTLLPGLLQRLRAGMALIGLPEADQRSVLDELLAVHTEALRPGKGEQAEPSAQDIVQRLRDEAVPDTPTKPPFSESLIDLGSLETVPADVLPSGGWAQENAAKGVDAMSPGDRYLLFLQGRWTRVQLLWRSLHGHFFLFAGTDPNRTHSATRRAIERLSEEGLMKPLEDVSLIQRAVDDLMQKLLQAP